MSSARTLCSTRGQNGIATGILCPFAKQTASEGATPAEALAEVPLERMAEAENWTLAEEPRNKEIKNALLKWLG